MISTNDLSRNESFPTNSDSTTSSYLEYNAKQVRYSLFGWRMLKKLTAKPNDKTLLWVKSFAENLSYSYSSPIWERGVALANRFLDFPDESLLAGAIGEHLNELVKSDFFKGKCINEYDWAQNQAENILIHFREAIEATAKPSKLIGANEVPENIEVNSFFISDPRIMLYNIFVKSGKTQLSLTDDTIEMELAFILESLREKFVQKMIPQNHKDRIAQEDFLKNRLQNRLTLIESGEKKTDVNEKIINICYKSIPIEVFMRTILKGAIAQKYYYTDDQDQRKLYAAPIAERQGYTNPQVMIDYVHKVIKDQQKRSSLLEELLQSQYGDNVPEGIKKCFNEKTGAITELAALLKNRLQSQYGNDAPEKIKEYFDERKGTITKLAVRAILYSTGYLSSVL